MVREPLLGSIFKHRAFLKTCLYSSSSEALLQDKGVFVFGTDYKEKV